MRERLSGAALLAVPLVFWGGSYRVTAVATAHAPGLLVAALRVGGSAVLLLVLLPLLRARFPRGRLLLWAGASGLLMVTVFYDGFTEGVRLAGPANASVLTNTAPLVAVACERVFLGTRLPRVALLGLPIGFAGVTVMVANELGGASGGGRLVAGLVLSFGAAAGWAAGTVWLKWLLARTAHVDLTGFTAAQLAIGGAVTVAIGFGAEGAGDVAWSSGELWLALAYLGAGATVAATLFYFFALRRLSAARTSTVLFLVPVAAILHEIVRGSAPGALTLAGMLLGVALVNAPPARLEARLQALS